MNKSALMQQRRRLLRPLTITDDKEDIKMAAIQTAGKTTNGHGSFTRIARRIPNLP